MFDWSKNKKNGGNGRSTGLDFAAVDAAKAEQMFQAGQLEKLFLLPEMFGGQDVPQNTLYVPLGIAAIKSEIDNNIVAQLIQEGKISNYEARPHYRGSSVIPSKLTIHASEPGEFITDINIWGIPSRQSHQPL